MAMPPAVKEQTTALDRPRPILPQNMETALEFCNVIAESGIVPDHYLKAKNPQAALFAALQLGAEVGLSPMACIQSIYVVNGYPKIYGEAALALCRQSGLMEYFREWTEGAGEDFVAHCETKRTDDDHPIHQRYSWRDAEFAGLLNKSGPWKTDSKRMCQWRARQRCLSDAFPDVLKGLARSVSDGDDAPLTGPDKAKPVGGDTAQNVTDFNARLKDYKHADETPDPHPTTVDADFSTADEIEQPAAKEPEQGDDSAPDEAGFKKWFDDVVSVVERKRSPNTLVDYIKEIQPQIDQWSKDFPDECAEMQAAIRDKMESLKPPEEPSAPHEEGAADDPPQSSESPNQGETPAPSSPSGLPDGSPQWAIDLVTGLARQKTVEAVDEYRKGFAKPLSEIAFSDDPAEKKLVAAIQEEIRKKKVLLG